MAERNLGGMQSQEKQGADIEKTKPDKNEHWQKLQAHFLQMRDVKIQDLFAQDPERFQKFSLRANDILLDYSKNILVEETVRLLLSLAREMDLQGAIESMFSEKPSTRPKTGPSFHRAQESVRQPRVRERCRCHAGHPKGPRENGGFFGPGPLRTLERAYRQADRRHRQHRNRGARTWAPPWFARP